MINVVEMWWALELEKMMSNIKCSLHQQWLGAAVCSPCCCCRQRAGTNISQMEYQDIDFRKSACSVGRNSNWTMCKLCTGLLQSAALPAAAADKEQAAASSPLPLSLCLEKILLFKSHPEISDRLQPTQQPVQLLANSKPNRDSIAITSNSNWNQANLVCSRHLCHPNLLKILQTEFEKHVFLRKIAF